MGMFMGIAVFIVMLELSFVDGVLVHVDCVLVKS